MTRTKKLFVAAATCLMMTTLEHRAKVAPGAARRSTVRKSGVTVRTRKRLRSTVANQRSEFLRLCRARIKPSDVGLPMARLTRSGGLRREDVAAISGVSASWYTWLEQGRDMRVSDDVLERLSETLKLSEDERIYLFTLVQGRPPRLRNATRMEAPPDTIRMISALSMPAIVMNLRWDVLGWNKVNSLIYRDYATRAPTDRNLLEILLIRPVQPALAQTGVHPARLRYSSVLAPPVR